jgi:broad specificity phosphatase PhoE
VTVAIYLVRHAKAGDRGSWSGDDFLRPLSRRGQIQAEALLVQFADVHLDRLLSSPYIRCMETLVPLAGVRRIPIEPADAITEGATLESALTLVRKHAHHDAVFCSHGDIIPLLLEHFASTGVDLGPNPSCPKGCTWILEFDGAHDVVAAKYVPPPAE